MRLNILKYFRFIILYIHVELGEKTNNDKQEENIATASSGNTSDSESKSGLACNLKGNHHVQSTNRKLYFQTDK